MGKTQIDSSQWLQLNLLFSFPFSSLAYLKRKKNLSDSNRCRISSVIFFVYFFFAPDSDKWKGVYLEEGN